MVSVLRARPYYPVRKVVQLYKSFALSFLEFGVSAYHHAPAFFLSLLDGVQERFLTELGMSKEDALMYYSLAPLSTRRDIALLGVLYRAATGKAPSPLRRLLRPASSLHFPRDFRQGDRHHYY